MTKNNSVAQRGSTSAFPDFENESGGLYQGMNLREYYAGQALVGLLAGIDDPDLKECAGLAVNAADALLGALDA